MAGIVLAVLAAGGIAHANGFAGRFVLDDPIMLGHQVQAPAGGVEALLAFGGKDSPAAGRPLTALSFLGNLALEGGELPPSGVAPASFHAVNLLVHLAAGLALLGASKRAFGRVPALEGQARALATVVALLWTVHPLHTGSVTYVSQRAESLMGLFFLLGFYCALRGAEATRPRAWYAAAAACGLLSVCGKEVGVLLPVVFLLFDRACLAGGFAAALRERRSLYLAWGASWAVALALLLTDPRPNSVVWEPAGVNPLNYALSQALILWRYLRLALWPDPLLLDYGWPVVPVTSVGDLAAELPHYGPALAALLAIVGLVAWLLARHPRTGFLPAAFFLILAPSSSFVPITTEIMAPHRMYLPLAAVIAGGVLLAYRGWQTGVARGWLAARAGPPAAVLATLALTSLGIALTRKQNELFASNVALWEHHARVEPGNPRALLELGLALERAGEPERAAATLERSVEAASAIRVPPSPRLVEAHMAAAAAYRRAGDGERAAAHLEKVVANLEDRVRAEPRRPELHHELGVSLWRAGSREAAIASLRRAAELAPERTDFAWALAEALLRERRVAEAEVEVARALGVKTGSPEARAALERAAGRLGHLDVLFELRSGRR